MSDFTIEPDEFFGAAIEKLKATDTADTLYQGVTIPVMEAAGVRTRGRTRKSTDDGNTTSKKSRPRRGKDKIVEEDSSEDDDRVEQGPQPPPGNPPSAPPGDTCMSQDAAILFSMMTRLEEKQDKIISLLSSVIERMDKDRQTMNNLSLRVETLQKARMLGLTAQPTPTSGAAASSGPTPHITDDKKGPVFI
ncbi:unnamed protein product [Parnassius apollo]|uniref:(apollo) hypothetical protein n=1 Tax=Parnassius apollo TaxID=110799 RepID=A0A8S3YCR7_PARAO|nr:unnamed protein product [Parnassius apollo]